MKKPHGSRTNATPTIDPLIQFSSTTRREMNHRLAEEDKMTVARARKVQRFLSQPFHVAEVFTGTPGKYVTIKDTIDAFKEILDGKLDEIPEQAFYMVGNLEEVKDKAKALSD